MRFPRSSLPPLAFAAAALALSFALEREAAACGGCFVGETPTVVTDHRMILSVSKDQSTLYDQIRYTGSPASFAWVLPISGTVEVGISADTVFARLDQRTTTTIQPPPRNCTEPERCAGRILREAGAVSATGGGSDVAVTKREVVGPYETVQLEATNPGALQAWLAANGFVVPADVQPVVSQYVNEKYDFLALKLIPGKGVQDMRPVRVTTKGASTVLPLRMVAAGSGAVVGISLWVIGEGRYEPQSFPLFTIASSELVWDWTQSRSNYTELRAQKTAAGAGRAWEIESSTELPRQAFTLGDADGYEPVKDPQGDIIKSAFQVRDEDLAALLPGAANLRVTRMRADLGKAALSADLVMTASADQALLPTTRLVTAESAPPLCPVYDGECRAIDNVTRDEAAARNNAAASASSTSSSSCATGQRSSSPVWLGAAVAMIACVLARARRRRR